MSDPTGQPDQYDGMGGSYVVGPDGVRVLVERTGESLAAVSGIDESPSPMNMPDQE